MPYNWTVAFVLFFIVQVRKRIRIRKRRGTKRKRSDDGEEADLSKFGDWVPLCYGTLKCKGVASKNLESYEALVEAPRTPQRLGRGEEEGHGVGTDLWSASGTY